MPDDFLERIRKTVGDEALPDLETLDRRNDLHVDRAAAELLRAFLGSNDASALNLLCDLTESRLCALAEDVERDLGLIEDSAELVVRFFEMLMVDLGPPPPAGASFLKAARDAMRTDAEARVRDIALSSVQDPTIPSVWVDGAESPSAADRQQRATLICFHRLDLPSRRVLRARNVENLTNEQIARRMALTPAEVEELFEDASFRLAEGIELELSRSRGHVVRHSGDRRRGRMDDAQKHQLASFGYGMARTCLHVVQGGLRDHLRFFTEVPSIVEQLAEVTKLSGGNSKLLTVSNLPQAMPRPDEAVAAGWSCLDFAESMEGSTARMQFLRSMLACASGDHEGAADRLRYLLGEPLQIRWRMFAQEGLQCALLALGDYSEAVSIGHDVLRTDPTRATAAYNLLAAYSWMGARTAFHRDVSRLTQSLVGVEDRPFWVRTLQGEAATFGEVFDLDPKDFLALVLPPDAA